MVQWNESVMVRLRDVNYTEEDLKAAWYSEDDIRRCKVERKEIKHLARRFASIELFETTMGDVHSCHGLERHLSRTKEIQRRETIRACWNVVLTLQHQHRKDASAAAGITDEVIAKAYRMCTQADKREAIARALLYMARSNQITAAVATAAAEEEKEAESVTTTTNTSKPLPTMETNNKSNAFSAFLTRFSSVIAQERVL